MIQPPLVLMIRGHDSRPEAGSFSPFCHMHDADSRAVALSKVRASVIHRHILVVFVAHAKKMVLV